MNEWERGEDLYTTNTLYPHPYPLPTQAFYMYIIFTFFFVENNVHLSSRGVRDMYEFYANAHPLSASDNESTEPQNLLEQRNSTPNLMSNHSDWQNLLDHRNATPMKLCVYDLSLKHCKRSDHMLLVHISS